MLRDGMDIRRDSAQEGGTLERPVADATANAPGAEPAHPLSP